MRFCQLLTLLTVIFSGGCNVVGPTAVKSAGLSYNEAIQYTTDQQLLMNIVRLRYRDNPSFMEVTSVATSYSLGHSLGAGVDVNDSAKLHHFDLRSITGTLGGNYSESPTITYAPLKGERFVKHLLTPVDPETIFMLYYSGWSIERLFRCMVYRLNDVLNAPRASGPTPTDKPVYEEFHKLTRALRSLQKKNLIHLVAHKQGDKTTVSLVFEKQALNNSEAGYVRRILNLNPSIDNYPLVSDLSGKEDPDKIMIGTRSLMGVLFYLSHGVEVPVEDYRAGVVTETFNPDKGRFDWSRLTRGIFRVRSDGGGNPGLAISYRGENFYIDDSDLTSKSTFMLISQVYSLQSGDVKSTGPTLTIPVGR